MATQQSPRRRPRGTKYICPCAQCEGSCNYLSYSTKRRHLEMYPSNSSGEFDNISDERRVF